MATGGVLSQGDRGLGQSFTDDEMRAIIATAHALGLKVAAHAHADDGIAAAVRAGVDSIEHGTFASAATDPADAPARHHAGPHPDGFHRAFASGSAPASTRRSSRARSG